MPVPTGCYPCNKKVEIAENEGGQRGRCPACRGLFTAVAATDSGAAPPSEAGILTVEPVVEGSGGVPSGRVVQPSSQLFLRTIVLLCGLLGAGACATLGFLWWTAQVNMK